MKFFNKKYEFENRLFFLTIAFFLCIPAFFNGGRNFYLHEVISLLIAVSAIFLVKNNEIDRKDKYIYLSLFIFIICLFISACFSVSFRHSFVSVFDYLDFALIFLIASVYKFRQQKIIKLFELLLYSGLVISALGFYYFFIGDFARVTSTFYWPNPLAGYLLFILPIALYLFFLKSSKLGLLSFFVSILTLVFTGSRGAFLSLGISLLFLLVVHFFTNKKGSRKKILNLFKKTLASNIKSLVLFFILSVLIFITILSYKNDLGSFNRYNKDQRLIDYSSSIRLNYWQGAISIFKEQTLLGSGPDTFSIVYPKFQKDILSSGKYAHNWLLEMLAEFGLLGLIPFLIFVGLIYYNFLKRAPSFLNFFLFFGITASFLHNLLDFDWHFYANAYLIYFFLGLSLNSSLFSDHNQNKDLASNEDLILTSGPELKKVGLINFLVRSVCFLFVFGIIIKSYILLFENLNFLKATAPQVLENKETAENNFRQSIKFNNPEYLRYYLQYLISAPTPEHLKEADELSDILLKKDQSFAYNYYLRGEVLFLSGNYSLAGETLKKAFELDKVNYPEFYFLEALSYIKLGEIGEAKGLLLKNISYYTPELLNDKQYVITNNQKLETNLNDRASSLYLLLANINLSEKNIGEAKKLSVTALQISPKNPAVLQFRSLNNFK